MAKKKKSSKKSNKQKIIDICRHIDYNRDLISSDITDALLSGRDEDLPELLYLDSRLKDLSDRLNCSGVGKKSQVDKSLGQTLLKVKAIK